jgi:hypothetical protein
METPHDAKVPQYQSERGNLRPIVEAFGCLSERFACDMEFIDRLNLAARRMDSGKLFGHKYDAAGNLKAIRVDHAALEARKRHFGQRMELADALKELAPDEEYGAVARSKAAGRMLADMGIGGGV